VRANWNDAFLDEAESFPVGRLKDRIDASSRAFAGLVRKRSQVVQGSGGWVGS
jgi:phage terminase large subunit-like protein